MAFWLPNLDTFWLASQARVRTTTQRTPFRSVPRFATFCEAIHKLQISVQAMRNMQTLLDQEFNEHKVAWALAAR